MNNLDHRFGGIQRLYGQDQFKTIQSAHIAVIGLGGVGSWTVEALARTGVGHLTLVDFDDICISNTNRQIHALQETVGKLKTQVLQERVAKINPAATVTCLDLPYDKDNESEIFNAPFDGMVDAIDHAYTKYYMALACRERKIPLVLSGSAGGRLDPSQIKTADLSRTVEDQMLAALRKKLRQRAHFPRKGPMGLSCVFSTESAFYSDSDGCVTDQKPADFNKPLDCATGFGTVTHITGTFGFMLSHLILQKVLQTKMS